MRRGAFTGLFFSRMQSAAAADRIAGLFHTVPIPSDWFSADMLAAVPIAQIRAITQSLTTQFGAFASATPVKDGSYDVEFANGAATFLIFIGADGKIEGLIAQPH